MESREITAVTSIAGSQTKMAKIRVAESLIGRSAQKLLKLSVGRCFRSQNAFISFEARDGCTPAPASSDFMDLSELLAVRQDGNAHLVIGAPRKAKKRGRRNAHNGKRICVEADGTADDAGVAAESPFPEVVGEHRLGRPAASLHIWREGLSQHGFDAKKGEEIGRHEFADDSLGAIVV